MRKIKLYIAVSLNGKIARSDGSVDWLENLPNPENEDHGFSEFYKSIDTTIQGFKTYDLIRNRGIEIPSKDKINYVVTRKRDIKNTKYVNFINENPVAFIKNLKKQRGKDIWLIGGGQLNTLLLNEGLIDELQLFMMPIVLPDGIELFENIPIEKHLTFLGVKAYSSGAVELRYSLL